MQNEKPKTDWRNIGLIAATAFLTVSAVTGAFWLGISQAPKGDDRNVIVQNSSTEEDLKIRGNRASKIYHLPGCPNYNDIAERNIVWFKTREAAEAAGFRMAKNC
jgi:hypothetical protein